MEGTHRQHSAVHPLGRLRLSGHSSHQHQALVADIINGMLRCRLSFNFVRNEFLTSRRRFSAAAKQRAKHETIQVPCQSNGSISLEYVNVGFDKTRADRQQYPQATIPQCRPWREWSSAVVLAS